MRFDSAPAQSVRVVVVRWHRGHDLLLAVPVRVAATVDAMYRGRWCKAKDAYHGPRRVHGAAPWMRGGFNVTFERAENRPVSSDRVRMHLRGRRYRRVVWIQP